MASLIKPRSPKGYKQGMYRSQQSSPFRKTESYLENSYNRSSRNKYQKQTVEVSIENVKSKHKKVIYEMEVNYMKQAEEEEMRIMKLGLETLWIHFLDKSFNVETAAEDLEMILENVKELKNDWVMMVRHYESFQRRVAHKVMQKEFTELEQDIILEHIQKLINQKQDQQLKIEQLLEKAKHIEYLSPIKAIPKRSASFNFLSQRTNKQCSPIRVTQPVPKMRTQRRSRFSQAALEQQPSYIQFMPYMMESQQKVSESPTLRRLNNNSLKTSIIYRPSQTPAQIPSQTPEPTNQQKYIQQLVQISQHLGQQLQSKQQLLCESLLLLAKAKNCISNHLSQNPKSPNPLMSQIVTQIQTLQQINEKLQQSRDNILKKVQQAQQQLTKRKKNHDTEVKDQIQQQQQQQLDESKSIKSYSAIDQSPDQKIITLQQKLSQVNSLLKRQKDKNKILEQSLKNNEMIVEQKNKDLENQVMNFQNVKKRISQDLRISYDNIKLKQDEMESEFKKGRLNSLLECFFPEEENNRDQETTIKEIRKLRKKIENYNDSRSLNTSCTQSPTEALMTAIHNFIQHLGTIPQDQRQSVILSLKKQVSSIADGILPQQMSQTEFQQQIQKIISKVYNSVQTPIRKQITQFALHLFNRKPEDILYLFQQFTRKIGRFELVQSRRRSSVDGIMKSASHSLKATPPPETQIDDIIVTQTKFEGGSQQCL